MLSVMCVCLECFEMVVCVGLVLYGVGVVFVKCGKGLLLGLFGMCFGLLFVMYILLLIYEVCYV